MKPEKFLCYTFFVIILWKLTMQDAHLIFDDSQKQSILLPMPGQLHVQAADQVTL